VSILVARWGFSSSPTTNAALLPEGRALVEQARVSGSPALVTHTSPLCTSADSPIHRGLATPLRAHGEVLGVLLLCDDRPELLRSGVQESVTLLANQAGIALRNAALYGEIHTSNQRLQELDRLKGEFISIASHELRTPLSIVLGYTMMVRDHVHNEQHEYLQRVLDNAQRIKDIVDDMVNLRHLETGEVTLNLHEHRLQALVSQAVERMLPAATRKRQRLNAYLPEDPVTFLADNEKYLLVLGHLISNAIKFTAEGEQIEIRGDLWRWDGAAGGSSSAILDIDPTRSQIPERIWHDEWVIIQVCDTGIGIPEREQTRIFERFYQVADSLTREHGGTGLGLAIVHELVALQNGVVWVTSSEAAGSIFSVALPYRTPCNEAG
jgi:signal transduction histidine kinase